MEKACIAFQEKIAREPKALEFKKVNWRISQYEPSRNIVNMSKDPLQQKNLELRN